MTSCTSHSGEGTRTVYESFQWVEAEGRAGVRYRIARISVARRIDLARRIREVGRRMEFLAAGGDARETLEALVLAGEMDQAYLEWGLEAVEGLTIDGEAATPQSLIAKGPVDMAGEILARIKAACGLNDGERKN